MATYFADTSALVKHFHSEPGTDVVERHLNESGARFWISRLTCVEVVSSLHLKYRTGIVTVEDIASSLRLFRREQRKRRYVIGRILLRHFQAADELIRRHGLSRRMRTLDALQLAVALDIHGREGISAFLCADQILCELASMESLTAINPEYHP